jgi:hypothetical protein
LLNQEAYDRLAYSTACAEDDMEFLSATHSRPSFLRGEVMARPPQMSTSAAMMGLIRLHQVRIRSGREPGHLVQIV